VTTDNRHSKLRGGADAVLFDLDGTLVDTAPDMVAVLQALQADRGEKPLAYDFGRAHVSNGALGLLRVAFPALDDEGHTGLLPEYLERYADRLCEDSALFDGLEVVLDRLDEAGRPWGVVTNKPGHLTIPLLDRLALGKRLACVVSGDTLPQRKPDPAPLLHACELAGLRPESTLYVGDAARDIEAGRRAGMKTVAAAYGYITPGDDAASWGADAVVATTAELAEILLEAVRRQ
jgi:phosphoglycolate phosphatase